ncbi:AraC family transcriptional regulator [Flavobacterium endoglycinae]|uniref:AraC family transcriptional regulator n=1 Tax=Flavobacterium endoglycinae TaxID=2816357 RepID=A0ABX7QGE3_9FLAO|nr:helix-turn-helix domain-containing protein [Flavobacterium endoglycinae]QSW90155.1 AraC family transcriptional regulator [Flavobacterium endoglycinae]
MANFKPYRINSISEIHQLMGLPKPHHPLISIVDLKGLRNDTGIDAVIFDMYVISMKRGCDGLHYGQQKYDFDEGLMAFLSPGQVLRGEESGVPPNLEGWMLFVHPDFLWNTSLAKKIKKYEYFGYSTSEALFLSDKEETVINDIVKNIKEEYHSNIDKFSQDIIISNLETLLNYSERFYERQFITRKVTNHKLLERVEDLLENYFLSNQQVLNGIPSVDFLAQKLNISPKYLSSMLKQLTGLTAQQHIQIKVLEQAKEKLSTSGLTVSEIAFDLGFEHSQSFSKFFKSKTNLSPLEFRKSFN